MTTKTIIADAANRCLIGGTLTTEEMKAKRKSCKKFLPLRRWGGKTGFQFNETGSCSKCGRLKSDHTTC